jgi:hypothetical protein
MPDLTRPRLSLPSTTVMLMVAQWLTLSPLLRGNSGTLRRLRESRAELRALDESSKDQLRLSSTSPANEREQRG